MRIDLTQVAAAPADVGNATAQIDHAQRRSEASHVKLQSTPEQHTQATPPAKPVPLPQPTQLNVSVDDRQNVIYRFTNPENGNVIRQVPPEEILRIMRDIEDLLHESEQKLKVTL
jgi:hypothetical protein